MSAFEPEESWEAEIGALLGALPEVDPPEGFIAAAIDHRPLWAMRTMLALIGAVVVATAASLAVGGGEGTIIPAVEDLTERHLQATARLEDGDGGDDAADPVAAPSNGATDRTGASGSLLSQGYVRAETVDADDLRQAVYARDGDVVSVFEVAGELAWDELPPAGRTTVGDTPAWVDEQEAVTIVQTEDGVVAIVGVAPGEVAELIDDLPTRSTSLLRRAEELATAITVQLGFPG